MKTICFLHTQFEVIITRIRIKAENKIKKTNNHDIYC